MLASAPSGGRRPGALWTKGVERLAHAFFAQAYRCVPILCQRLLKSRDRHSRSRRTVEPLIPSLLRNQGPTFLNNSSSIRLLHPHIADTHCTRDIVTSPQGFRDLSYILSLISAHLHRPKPPTSISLASTPPLMIKPRDACSASGCAQHPMVA